VVGLYDKVLDLNIKLLSFLSQQSIKFSSDLVNQHRDAVLGTPHKVIVQVANTSRCVPVLHSVSIQDMLDKHNVSNRKEVSAGLLLLLENDSPRPAFSMAAHGSPHPGTRRETGAFAWRAIRS
jgi:hypothetical protein